MTQQERENISQLIRSTESHELGMLFAHQSGYAKKYNWDFRIDYWYYQDNYESGVYNSYSSLVEIKIGSLSFRIIVLKNISRTDPYYLEFKYEDECLAKNNRQHRGMVEVFSRQEVNKFISIELIDVQGCSEKQKSLKTDGVNLYEYVFQQIQANRPIFEQYINQVPCKNNQTDKTK